MNDIVKIILSSIGSTTVVTTVAVFVLREWLTHKIKADVEHTYNEKLEIFKDGLLRSQTKEIEGFRQNLTTSNTKDIEQLKSQLTIIAAQKHFRYSHAFERTAKTIEDTYARLTNLDIEADRLKVKVTLKNKATQIEQLQKVLELHNELVNWYFVNTLYLPLEASRGIKEFHYTLNQATVFYQEYLSIAQNSEESDSKYKKAVEQIDKLPPLLGLILGNFQMFFGILRHDVEPTAEQWEKLLTSAGKL